MLKHPISPLIFLLLLSLNTFAQQYNNTAKPSVNTSSGLITGTETGNDPNASVLTLNECLKYALKNQPALNQSYIDEAIARTNNAIAFSPWLPQVSGAANYLHYFQLPTSFSNVNGTLTPIQSGVA